MKKNKKMILAVALLMLGAWLNGVIKINVTVDWKAMAVVCREISSKIALTIGVNIITQYIVRNNVQVKG